MDHTVKNKHFPGVFEATPLRAPVRPWGHAPRQANPVLTQGRRGAQGRDTPPYMLYLASILIIIIIALNTPVRVACMKFKTL